MRTLTVLLLALFALNACDSGDGDSTPADVSGADTPVEVAADVAPYQPTSFDYEVPLAEDSPWPKFRRDARQTGASPVELSDDGRALWRFPTGKGIFSSPVIGGDGTIYIGSADRMFYALNPDGTEKWRFETGEIIDSSALLDERGWLYFASGDGWAYALDAATGEEQWRMEADPPSITGAIINWFEGNVAILPSGQLLVPNDNRFLYAIDRDTGVWDERIRFADQTWSLPAVDVAHERIVVGNNAILEAAGNVYAFGFDFAQVWMQAYKGSVAASPLVLPDGASVAGCFDGYIRAFELDGSERWVVPARDHVYASAALHPEGFVVVPSADGTVYALSPEDGAAVWAFDWGAPMRSSPAVDGAGLIYLGTGDGHLLVLNADGSLRWALRLIDADRDDLNASPALGYHAVYIAGESGEVFGVPFDFCLRAEEADNEACTLGPDEPLPQADASVLYLTRFGTALAEAPAEIDANQALAFAIQVRSGGETSFALIDADSLTVSVLPPSDVAVHVSADRRFFTLVPEAAFLADAEGALRVQVNGTYLVDPERDGLATSGGRTGDNYSASFSFQLAADGPETLPLPVPSAPGDPAGVWEMRRLAAPLPTLLPSYNQIGFDSLHFLIGLVEGDGTAGVAWVVEGRPTGPNGETEVAAGTAGMFPFAYRYDEGRLTLANEEGMSLEVMSVVLGLGPFRVATRLDDSGAGAVPANVHSTTVCGDIPLYGTFIRDLGLCHPVSDVMVAYGAVLLDLWSGGTQEAPEGVGTVSFTAGPDSVRAELADSTLRTDEHAFALLLVDDATGAPVSLPYGPDGQLQDAEGVLTAVTMPFARDDVPDRVRVYLMVDAYPAARTTVDLPVAK